VSGAGRWGSRSRLVGSWSKSTSRLEVGVGEVVEAPRLRVSLSPP
jgi:hypothetical protein